MKTIVTEISEGVIYYNDLCEWVKSLDLDPESEDFEALSLMDGDPDKIKYKDREFYFITVDLNDTKYVLTSEEVNEEEKKVLTDFFDEEFENNFLQVASSWDNYNNANNVIAYRGGSGYMYTIWLYKK